MFPAFWWVFFSSVKISFLFSGNLVLGFFLFLLGSANQHLFPLSTWISLWPIAIVKFVVLEFDISSYISPDIQRKRKIPESRPGGVPRGYRSELLSDHCRPAISHL